MNFSQVRAAVSIVFTVVAAVCAAIIFIKLLRVPIPIGGSLVEWTSATVAAMALR